MAAFTANDVLALARAGYNSAQIAMLSGAMTEQQPAQQPAQQPGPADFMAELQKLTGALQLQNQLNSQQPKPETVDDILASVINP